MELTSEQLPKAVATILESIQRIEKLLELRSEFAVESDKFMTIWSF